MDDNAIAQMLKRLDFHSERLNALEKDRESIAVIAKRFEQDTHKTEKSYKYLFGNGEPGLDEIMRDVVEYIKVDREAKETRKKEERDDRRNYMKVVVGAALSTIVMLFINGIIWFIKILPVLEGINP